MSRSDKPSQGERVRAYHELSKHHLDRYAPGPGKLDWANQPDPFRRFDGSPPVELPLAADGIDASFSALRRPGAVPAAPLSLDRVGALLEISLGLSAWKSSGGNRWALRCNPSSGNLHPTEAYIVCPGIAGLGAGVYHYRSLDHSLEQRAAIDPSQDWDGALGEGLILGLSSIHWREAWKYGVRAYRYCQHDLGHALAAVRYAAAALGWKAILGQDLRDAEIARLLGLSRAHDFSDAEPEHADLLLAVGPEPDRIDISTLLELIGTARWSGQANRLSPHHRPWDEIPDVAGAARKTWVLPERWDPAELPPLPAPSRALAAVPLVRGRRSALAFDGRATVAKTDFFTLLDALLPREGVPPWDALPWAPLVHPVLFVHRVEGLESGLYLLVRNGEAEARLRTALGSDWSWQRPAESPAHLPLFRLKPGDLTELARLTSCHQDIAADSAFALAMLADFDAALARGAYWYRHLFWEAGVLGQALYLEAEAAGARGTGIGCFFDDAVHRMLGLAGSEWQDIYHFTVGAPVEDPRIETHPPYAHRKQPAEA